MKHFSILEPDGGEDRRVNSSYCWQNKILFWGPLEERWNDTSGVGWRENYDNAEIIRLGQKRRDATSGMLFFGSLATFLKYLE